MKIEFVDFIRMVRDRITDGMFVTRLVDEYFHQMSYEQVCDLYKSVDLGTSHHPMKMWFDRRFAPDNQFLVDGVRCFKYNGEFYTGINKKVKSYDSISQEV